MKKILALLFGTLIFVSAAFANDASMDFERDGGTVYPVDNTKIRMMSEVINVHVDDNYCDSSEGYVECKFVFENTSNSSETVLMGFPGDEGNMKSSIYGGAISDFKTTINEKNVDVKILKEENEDEYCTSKTWFTWEVTFKPNETITVYNTYVPHWSHGCDGPYEGLGFGYIITTGKGWFGNIGETTVNFYFNNLDKFDYYNSNCPKNMPYIKRNGNKLVFNRKDYEPEEDLKFNFDIESWVRGGKSLLGKTICINPGHQGKGNSEKELLSPNSLETKAKVTTGAAGESELNLKIANNLKKYLEHVGAKVIMTRDSQDVDISNKERAEIGNKADLAISIHCNSAENANANGTLVIYPSDKNAYNSSVAKQSKILASYINSRFAFAGAYNVSSENRISKLSEREDLTTLNWSTVPAIIIETGFLSNAEDAEYVKKLADYNAFDYLYSYNFRYEDAFYGDIVSGIGKYFNGGIDAMLNNKELPSENFILKQESEKVTYLNNEAVTANNNSNKLQNIIIIVLIFLIIVIIILNIIFIKKFNKNIIIISLIAICVLFFIIGAILLVPHITSSEYIDEEIVSEYIFGDSDKRKLSKEEVNLLTDEEKRFAKNEIFARYGYDFSTADMKQYFATKSWYKRIEGKKVNVSELNAIEQYNVSLINACM